MTAIDRHNRLSEQRWQPLLFVLLSVLIAVLPIIIFRDFTPSNELRYLSIADESLASGRWWAFTNHGIPYADKPPLYLWCVIFGKFLLGSHQMWFLSLFSIIPAFVIACLMFRWTNDELKPPFSASALLMLFSCGLFAGMVFTIRMDMLMTMFIVLAFYQFRKLELSESHPSLGARLLFAVWIFLAVFSKGPMGILIPLIATTVWLLLTRRMRLWTRAWGWRTWALLLLLCAGWFGAVYAEGGSDYLDNLLVHQTVGRAVNSFHHKRPIWYYLVSLTYTTQPWTFLIFGAVVYCTRKFKRTINSLENFFLIIILSTFVLLSVISSKLQVYMLPAYPFMVYLTVMVCSRHKDSKLVAAGIAIPAVILLLAGIAAAFPSMIAGVAGLSLSEKLTALWLPLAAAILIIGTSLTLRGLYSTHRLAGAVSTLSSTVLALVFITGFAIRDLNPDIGYKAIAETAVQIKRLHPEAEIISYKLDRPENIDVYLQDIPFRIYEDADNPLTATTDWPVSPTIVMTEIRHQDEIPYIKESHPVGTKYTLLLTSPPKSL